MGDQITGVIERAADVDADVIALDHAAGLVGEALAIQFGEVALWDEGGKVLFAAVLALVFDLLFDVPQHRCIELGLQFGA